MDENDDMLSDGQVILMFIVTFLVIFMLAISGCSRGGQGDPGIQGPSGPQTPVLTQPASLQECPAGGVDLTIGTVTTTLCNGITGATGADGNQGPPGIDVSPITVVQLCTGVTPTYPNVFPEIGLCIAGNLYAVYSANGGFLVYAPPGAYYSNGINASCTFTVGPNCKIN